MKNWVAIWIWCEWAIIALCVLSTLIVFTCLLLSHLADRNLPAGKPVVEPAIESPRSKSAGPVGIQFRIGLDRSYLRLTPALGLVKSDTRSKGQPEDNFQLVPVLAELDQHAVGSCCWEFSSGEAQDSTIPGCPRDQKRTPAAGWDQFAGVIEDSDKGSAHPTARFNAEAIAHEPPSETRKLNDLSASIPSHPGRAIVMLDTSQRPAPFIS